MVYLPRPIYFLIRRLVPIACVDAMPYRDDGSGVEVGLIRRRSPDHAGDVWTLIGGRVRYLETLDDALSRHLRETLGSRAEWTIPDSEAPLTVGQYFPGEPRPGRRRDPHKHAIALAYPVQVTGEVEARGEATDFRWFSPDALPPETEIGFGQADVIGKLVAPFR